MNWLRFCLQAYPTTMFWKSCLLRANGIGEPAASSLANMLGCNSSLLALDLYCNILGNNGTNTLAKALNSNQTLRRLNLGKNQVSDEGMECLARALGKQKTESSGLQSLTLHWNRCTNHGARALADMLTTNRALLSLVLTENQLEYDGLQFLAKALETHNETLEYLGVNSIMFTGFWSGGAENCLRDARKENTGLREEHYSWLHRAPFNSSLAVAQQEHYPWVVQRCCFRNVLLHRTVRLVQAVRQTNPDDTSTPPTANDVSYIPSLFQTFRLYVPEQFQRFNAIVLYGVLRAQSSQTKTWLSLRKNMTANPKYRDGLMDGVPDRRRGSPQLQT